MSFSDNRSLQYNIDNDDGEAYPDENFAREIMQLFSVGLYQLNMDGSIVYQDNGNAKDTYSIDDIVSYSRGWTGFIPRANRGGPSANARGSAKSMDPMRINIYKRDWFPKSDLLGGFIVSALMLDRQWFFRQSRAKRLMSHRSMSAIFQGDKVPLCADLASVKHFLSKGAMYRLLGASGNPEWHDDPEWWTENPDFHRLDIEPSSPLYAKLCEEDANGECTLPAKVVLDENLAYDEAARAGAEYAVDTVRTVRLRAGATVIWYEYVRQPCVEHSFYR